MVSATNTAMANSLEAVGRFLTSTAPSECIPFVKALKIHILLSMKLQSYYAAFLLVAGISPFVIYHTYETMEEKVWRID